MGIIFVGRYESAQKELADRRRLDATRGEIQSQLSRQYTRGVADTEADKRERYRREQADRAGRWRCCAGRWTTCRRRRG